MAKTRPIRTAVIALGRAGWGIHVRNIRGNKKFVLVDVADVMEDRLAEAKAEFNCGTYTDWRKLLRESDAELVIVASQTRDHVPMSIAAMRAGKHVMVEKPMARNAREADRALKAAKETGRIFTVHQNHHAGPDILHVKQLIRSGKLGEVFMIKRRVNSLSRRDDWQTLQKYGGGVLNNTGIHMMEQLMQFGDPPAVKVFGDFQRHVNPGDAEDHAKLVWKFQSGLVIDFEVSSAYAAPTWTWVVLGSRGAMWTDGKTCHLKYVRPSALRKLKPVDGPLALGRVYGVSGKRETLPFVTKEMPFGSKKKVNLHDCLYETIRNGKPLLVDPKAVREVHALMDRARRGTGY